MADGGIQHLDDANAFLVVSPVKAPDGSPGGGVLMEYSKAGKSLQVRALAAQLAFVAALILAATAGAGWIFRS